MEGFGLEVAIAFLKDGHKLARSGWDARMKFIVVMPALQLPPHSRQEPGPKVNDRTAKHIGEDTPLDSQPYLAMFTSDGKWHPGVLFTAEDIFGLDWMIVK